MTDHTEVERLEAELKLAKIGEKFRAAKADGTLTRKMKNELRAGRQDYRDNYRVSPEGTAVNPGTIAATGGVAAVGGSS